MAQDTDVMALSVRPRKLVFSRKGFDSGSGGGPSPIVAGRPVSLPIPAYGWPSKTTYEGIGLGELVDHGGRHARPPILAEHFCHHDPYYHDGKWAFGQEGAAQSHLVNQGVTIGDIFFFFGLFEGDGHTRHHRIFGYMQIEEIIRPLECDAPIWAKDHPHFLTNSQKSWKPNNTVYFGHGSRAERASDALRLTASSSDKPSFWLAPPWLQSGNLSYHGKAERWREGLLKTVGRGQEFVADVSDNSDGQKWIDQTIAETRG